MKKIVLFLFIFPCILFSQVQDPCNNSIIDYLTDHENAIKPISYQLSQGYQVRVKDSSSGKSDFIFEHAINADAYRTLNPTEPAWAIDMPVDVHPNDVRSLVRVVNMLGQEVKAAEQFRGEVLLYMYNDGSVEKKMVK